MAAHEALHKGNKIVHTDPLLGHQYDPAMRSIRSHPVLVQKNKVADVSGDDGATKSGRMLENVLVLEAKHFGSATGDCVDPVA